MTKKIIPYALFIIPITLGLIISPLEEWSNTVYLYLILCVYSLHIALTTFMRFEQLRVNVSTQRLVRWWICYMFSILLVYLIQSVVIVYLYGIATNTVLVFMYGSLYRKIKFSDYSREGLASGLSFMLIIFAIVQLIKIIL